MSPWKFLLLALALVLPGGSLLLLALAAVNAVRARRPQLVPAKIPAALPVSPDRSAPEAADPPPFPPR